MPLRRHLLVFALLLVTLPAQALENFATSELTIQTAGGPQKFAIELALSDAQMEQGLMFRRSMPANAGMLFDFKHPTNVTMWMKNTLIPLDMLFLDNGARIIDIRERAVPYSTDIIASRVPARYVIELNGGTVARLGIKPGDQVSSPYFK
ncbi:MAG TPA: DUF192 domain-containing protein [Stellaceae bacterium]|jgi:hypothetical protein|nr:DUF192 domain-containing protein [Stellaceae bacterium]